jgi:hypothetical protein
LDDGKCLYWCSASFGGIRYCGTGKTFQGPGSIDCSGCKKPSVQGKFADFSGVWSKFGSITGKFHIEKGPKAVHWKVDNLKIDDDLISEACGKLLHGKPNFNYHLHEEWNFKDFRTSSALDCSLENVGNHWDPTAACGPASGNTVCDNGFCNTRGVNYTCDSKLFDPYSIAQYRLLTPSKLFPNGVTCEFGDFSGMAGPIEGHVEPKTNRVVTEVHEGKAAMSATFGEITPKTLDGRPYLSCSFGTLPKGLPMDDKNPTYEYASAKKPLDKLPEKASVLVHCGSNYEKANARFFCARVQDY